MPNAREPQCLEENLFDQQIGLYKMLPAKISAALEV